MCLVHHLVHSLEQRRVQKSSGTSVESSSIAIEPKTPLSVSFYESMRDRSEI